MKCLQVKFRSFLQVQHIVYLNELHLYTKMYMSLEAAPIWARTISNHILRFIENIHKVNA